MHSVIGLLVLDPNQPCPFAIRSDQPPVLDEDALFEVAP